MRELRIAVLISGGGRTLANLLRVQQQGELPGRIELVVSNREQIPGNEIARQAGIPLVIVPSRGVPEATFAERVYAALDTYAIDLVLLGGFLRRLPVRPDYRWRIMNIHPSLLPLFGGRGMYGERVHRAVLESGMKVTGCTVHFVDEGYDTGPIILQRCVPILDDDTPETLAARVLPIEHETYIEAIRLFVQGRLRVEGRRVRVVG